MYNKVYNHVRKALENFCNKYPSDWDWPKIEDFEPLKENKYQQYFGFGWGDVMGFNPSNYTWATLDTEKQIIQVMFKRGPVEIIHDINLEGEIILHHESQLPLIDWCRK